MNNSYKIAQLLVSKGTITQAEFDALALTQNDGSQNGNFQNGGFTNGNYPNGGHFGGHYYGNSQSSSSFNALVAVLIEKGTITQAELDTKSQTVK